MAPVSAAGAGARLLLGLLLISSGTTATATYSNSSSTGFNNTNSTIHWGSCGSNLNLTFPLLCGTLDVPLDYTATNGNASSLTLKLVKVPSAQQPSRGSILVNPGGPGIGGRNWLAEAGAVVQELTGTEFDIVSWDPRGTGDTLPVSCFSDATKRAYLEAMTPQASNKSEATLGQEWAAKGILAHTCSEKLADIGSLLGTAFVARDMMRIVDGLGEDGLLRYWGFSYGTLLGMTFAAMFPDKVDKVIIDGVLNPSEYYAGRSVQQVTDSDATFAGFIATCQLSPENCPLASYDQGEDTSLFRISKNLLEDLKDRPLALGPDARTQYVGYGELKSIILAALKSPSSWPDLALYIRLILDRDGARIAPLAQSFLDSLQSSGPFPEDFVLERLWAIRCSEVALRTDNLTDIVPLVQEFYKQSYISGDVLTEQPITCAQWPFRAKEVYSGKFENIVTRNPLLFIGNTFDPITPLVSARNASAAFVGSQVLAQNGYGHTSLAQASDCRTKYVQQYFMNGTLPAPYTVCETTGAPFTSNV